MGEGIHWDWSAFGSRRIRWACCKVFIVLVLVSVRRMFRARIRRSMDSILVYICTYVRMYVCTYVRCTSDHYLG